LQIGHFLRIRLLAVVEILGRFSSSSVPKMSPDQTSRFSFHTSSPTHW
jgi:hypothetical protein